MKIIKEEILFEKGKSFKIFSPRLKNYFYWHYHPEIELVFVETLNGIRHVGKNIAGFVENDLVLIGSNIPHLNFDYGIETEYNQIVVQFHEKFVQNIVVPFDEYESIRNLLEKASMGMSFFGETKNVVSQRLQNINKENPFFSLIELMEILYILANSKEYHILNSRDTSVKFILNDKVRMGAIYGYIHENFDKKPDVNEIAKRVHLSTSAFCRYFKKQTDMTFTDFVNQYRINQAQRLLLQDKNISEVCYNVGFESLSYFTKLFKRIAGQAPGEFKKQYTKKMKPRYS